jgi:hypothetical protein
MGKHCFWVLVALLTTGLATAEDRPIAAARLVLKRSLEGRERLVFVSKDPHFLFPTVGGADDPSAGSPGGALLELFSQNEGRAAFHVPAGVGDPGWVVNEHRHAYRFLDRSAPGGASAVRVVRLEEGRLLDLSGRAVGLPLAGPQGLVAVRITTGGLRNCALFDVTTVERDQARVFRASHADASALPDCSDDSLSPIHCEGSGAPTCGGRCPPGSTCGTRDLHTCVCIAASQACGTTGPVCNGECPAGEECMPIGGFPVLNCGCLPAGSVPCGLFTCNGGCPAGQECNLFVSSFPGLDGCQCGPPGPCGGGGDDCPAGFVCATGEFTMCVPVFCPPGGCGPGFACQPIRVEGVSETWWVCAPVGLPCDTACGGLTCPVGEVCTSGGQGCRCEAETACCQGSVPAAGVSVCADVPSDTAASRCAALSSTLAAVGGSASLGPGGVVCDGSGVCMVERTSVADCCEGDAGCAEGTGSVFADGCASLGSVLHPGERCSPAGACAP